MNEIYAECISLYKQPHSSDKFMLLRELLHDCRETIYGTYSSHATVMRGI